jgi:archaellum component FlaC
LQRIKEKADEAKNALKGLIADYELMIRECAKFGNEAKERIEIQVR